MTYEHIPLELRAFPQWVGWRYEDRGGVKPTKVPYQIRSGYPADVTNPNHYATWDDAYEAGRQGRFSGIGFCLTEHDPFAFIDLDDVHDDAEALQRQISIYNAFGSYSERSPSRVGLHIIVRGKLPNGRKRSFVEVYSKDRFMTMTGDVFRNAPIADQHVLLNQLHEQMGGSVNHVPYPGDDKELRPDGEVLETAYAAINGDKFAKLMRGEWIGDYSSQSEADQALINIIAFYTQHRGQITRIFRSSGLGQRPKAMRNAYIDYNISKSFDKLLPPIDLDAVINSISDALSNRKIKVVPTEAPGPEHRLTTPIVDRVGIPGQTAANTSDFPTYAGVPRPNAGAVEPRANTYEFPPGLVGDIASFIYASAPRPVREIALAGAIGFMAGVTGRAYNVSGVGLNQYIMLVAQTGVGKEAISSGIDKLVNALLPNCPEIETFVGPGEFASSQGMLKHLQEHPCIFSIAGEFGIKLKSMSAYNATPGQQDLKRLMLDLYNKSGHGKSIKEIVYSDKSKNSTRIQSPCFTLIGESTGKRFFEALDEGMVEDGLVPRFTIIEYLGGRPPLNEKHVSVYPELDLISAISSVVSSSFKHNQAQTGINVAASPEASAALSQFDLYCDGRVNQIEREAVRQLWSRAHMKALKLAATVAVGENYITPVISELVANWAINLVVTDTSNLIARFESGHVGGAHNSEWRQNLDFSEAVRNYFHGGIAITHKYGVPEAVYNDRLIPFQYFSRRLGSLDSFKSDRSGSANAVKRAIGLAIDRGDIQEAPPLDVAKRYQTRSKIYAVVNPKTFDI